MTFKKGQSGNPKGRKPRVVEDSITALLDSVVSPEDWEEVTAALVKLAKKGNVPAITALFDRRYGKPTERHELSGPNQGAITIKGVDYRTVATALAPGSVPDSDTSSEDKNSFDG